ncbi:TonB family protein [Aliikangiella sp. IMCC44359]|uniref:TonB family protein n=1 Tax=Aliikangiella sp. IMCC44359 TaxID=3459125 RepID=UPI00403B2DDC
MKNIFSIVVLILCIFIISGCMSSPNADVSKTLIKSDYRPTPSNDKNTAKPLQVKQPCFPAKAVRQKAEGWVQLEFSLDNKGRPKQIISLDDSPKGMFQNCALSSLKHWVFEVPVTHEKEARYQFVFQFKLG